MNTIRLLEIELSLIKLRVMFSIYDYSNKKNQTSARRVHSPRFHTKIEGVFF